MPKDLKAVGLAYARAIKEQRSKDAAEFWESFISALETRLQQAEGSTAKAGSSTTSTKATSLTATQQVLNPLQVPFSGVSSGKTSSPTGEGPEGSYKLRRVVAADGEAIFANAAVTVIAGVAGLAVNTDLQRPCHGICVTPPDINGQFFYRAGGEVIATMASDPDARGRIWLSGTPGLLTDDETEANSGAFVQEVGQFVDRVNSTLGASRVFVMEFQYAPPVEPDVDAFVESVTAGTGLTNSGTGTNPVLNVSYGTSAGTAAQGNDSRLSDSRTPTGAAGGDLGSTYPNPTVLKLNGSSLPTNAANGFIKRDSGNTAFEEVAYGSAANTVCQGNDSRLSDSRAPTGSAGGDLAGTYPNPTIATVGSALNVANGFVKRNSGNAAFEQVAYGSASNTVCQGNDSRLSDARTPVGTALTDGKVWVGSSGNLAAAVTPSGDVTISNAGVTAIGSGKVTNAMLVNSSLTVNGSAISLGGSATVTAVPSAHATSHKSGGGDVIKLDELAAPTDITTLNATTSAHGLLQKLPGGTSTFLRADGSFATPAGTSPLTTKGDSYVYSTVDVRLPVGTGGQVVTADASAATGQRWSNYYPDMAGQHRYAIPTGGAGTMINLGINYTISGTAASGDATNDTVGPAVFVTCGSTASGQTCGFSGNDTILLSNNPDVTMRIRSDSLGISDSRAFYGIGTSGDPSTSDTAATSFVGFRQTGTGGLGNWYGVVSNGSAQSSVDLGVVTAIQTNYILRVRYDTTADIFYFYINNAYAGQIASSANLPSTTTFMRSRLILRQTALVANVRGFRLMHCGFIQS